jgi:hypothetical protein
MVFRYPSPPAVSLGDVCTLSSKDIAETGSGALTKEGQRLADEKQQREEIAQEVSNRLVCDRRTSAHSAVPRRCRELTQPARHHPSLYPLSAP